MAVRRHIQEARTYLSLFVRQVAKTQRLYAAIAIPALVDPALNVPAVVVVATPRTTRCSIRGVLLQAAHRQRRQIIQEFIAIPLCPEQLRQLLP
jgi:hypothetical protein